MHRTSSKLASSSFTRLALLAVGLSISTGCASSALQESAAPRGVDFVAVAEAAAVRASLPNPSNDRGLVESGESSKSPSLVVVQPSFKRGSADRVVPSQGWNTRRFLGSPR